MKYEVRRDIEDKIKSLASSIVRHSEKHSTHTLKLQELESRIVALEATVSNPPIEVLGHLSFKDNRD